MNDLSIGSSGKGKTVRFKANFNHSVTGGRSTCCMHSFGESLPTRPHMPVSVLICPNITIAKFTCSGPLHCL